MPSSQSFSDVGLSDIADPSEADSLKGERKTQHHMAELADFFPGSVRSTKTFFLIDMHYKTIYESGRNKCSS